MSKTSTINPHGVVFSKARKTTYLLFLHLLANKTMIRKDLEKVVFKAQRGLKYMGNNFQHHTRENRFGVTKEGRNAIYTLTTIGKEYAKTEFGLNPEGVEGVNGVNGAKKTAKPAKAPAKKAPVKKAPVKKAPVKKAPAKAPVKKKTPAKAQVEALV